MKRNRTHITPALARMLTLSIFMLLITIPSVFAQNTKGDQPAGKTRQARETRFKSRSRQGDKAKTKDIAGRRLRTKNKSSANRANASYRQPSTARKSPRSGNDRQGRPVRPVYSSRPTERQRAWKGSSSGQRIQVRSATSRTRNVYPQRGRYVNNPSRRPRDPQQHNYARVTKRVQVKSSTGKIKNVYPQQGRYVNNPSRTGKSRQPIVSNKPTLRRLKGTSSRAYIQRHSINAFAGFWNKKQKGERAYKGDITGRKLRTKNFETKPLLHPANPTANPVKPRKRVGDRPYKGPALGGYATRSQSGRAWKGDITGRKIRGRNFSSKKRTEVSGKSIFPPRQSRKLSPDNRARGGFLSRSGRRNISTSPIPVRTPGIGASKIGKYQGNIRGGKGFSPQGGGYSGNIKSQRPLKGGGSRSGRLWNNKGNAITGRYPGSRALRMGVWQGNLKGQRPLKGGGSVSGRLWNNKGRALIGRYPGNQAVKMGVWSGNIRSKKYLGNQGEEFTGNIKARRPLKGGGSVSGKLWNNKGNAVTGRYPGNQAVKMGVWQGNLKGHRPLKGGGSVSGKLWNNKGRALIGRYPGNQAVKMGVWQGNLKGQRPLKGGGSVSGRLWNNKGNPLTGRYPGRNAVKMGVWQGDRRAGKFMNNQGEEFTGYIKARKPLKGGGSVSGKLWNNKEKPLTGRYPGNQAVKMGVWQGNIKGARKPLHGGGSVSGRLWNNKEKAINGKAPGPDAERIEGYPGKLKMFDLKPSMRNQGEEFTGTFKQKKYSTRPKASENAMKGIGPSKSSISASQYARGVKLKWKYVHNPSSSQEALKTREPGRAFARSTDYQGNIRMKKFSLFRKSELHPDAQFVKINKNNVKEERDFLTNFKLWWARLFRKNDTQPEHLKEKYHKPRYDKREQGLWYD